MNTKYSQEIINSAKDLIQADKIANNALATKWKIEDSYSRVKLRWENDEISKDQYFLWMDNLELAKIELRIANRKFEISLKEFRENTHHLWAMRDTDSASLLNEAIVIIEESNS